MSIIRMEEVFYLKRIKDRKCRIIIALAVSLFVLGMVNMRNVTYVFEEGKEITDQQLFSKEIQNLTPAYAWWGTIYPKFSFSERKPGKIKISFWIAKALEWW